MTLASDSKRLKRETAASYRYRPIHRGNWSAHDPGPLEGQADVLRRRHRIDLQFGSQEGGRENSCREKTETKESTIRLGHR
jgi:hypothetical protein